MTSKSEIARLAAQIGRGGYDRRILALLDQGQIEPMALIRLLLDHMDGNTLANLYHAHLAPEYYDQTDLD